MSLSLSVDMLLSAVSVLVVAQSSSEIPEGLMNNPVYGPLCKPPFRLKDVVYRRLVSICSISIIIVIKNFL